MTTTATCHCGGTRIEVPEMPTHATSCNCTWCTKTGALWAYYDPAVPNIVSDTHRGQFSHSGINEHYFCANCGCATYNLTPDWSVGDTAIPEKRKFALNARLIDGIDVKTLAIEELDGRNLW